ncbi:MAG: hypothetical protein ACP5ER_05235, partial [Candidatus Bathyarchaeales archaeon]
LSIVKSGTVTAPAYKIFFSLEQQPGQTGNPVIGYVKKRRKDEPKEYTTFSSAMSDIQKITGTNHAVTTIWPHSHPAAEAYIEHLLEPEYSLAMY